MKILDRNEAARRLGMTPNALSCHVYRQNWDGIPRPILIGGRNKWTEEQIDEWLKKKIEEAETASNSQLRNHRKQSRPGRPAKRRGASCS